MLDGFHTATEAKYFVLRKLTEKHRSIELSHELGYSFNQIDRWLNGEKQCRWGEFWFLCETVHAPLTSALKSVFAFPESDDPSEFLRYLRRLHPAQSIESLAERVHLHPATLKRYFRGDTSCELESVLALMNLSPQLMGTFIQELVGANGVFDAQTERSAIRNKLAMTPIAAAVIAALSLESYQTRPHNLATIAKALVEDEEQVARLLVMLESAGAVRWTGKHYEPVFEFLQMEGLTREALCTFARFWTHRSYLRLASPDGRPITRGTHPNYFGFRIVALSEEGCRKMSETLRKFHQEILTIEEGDSAPKNDVRVVLMHDFAAGDVPELTKKIRADQSYQTT